MEWEQETTKIRERGSKGAGGAPSRCKRGVYSAVRTEVHIGERCICAAHV